MTDQHDFTQLENALIEVGRSIEYPATPPLAARVRAQLSTDRSRPPVRSIFGSRRFAIGLAAIALVLIALLIIPQTRDVIAQILGLKTIRVIEVAPTATAIAATPAPTPTPGVVPFKQCCESTLAEAQAKARFKILLPPDHQPSQVFFQDQIFGRGSDAQQVVLVFGDPQQPGFVLYEARSWFYEKAIGGFGKGVGSGTLLTETEVNGSRALWITGAPHVLVTLDQRGEPVFGTERAVNANTLAWEVGTLDTGLTYRLETTASLEEAIRFAESFK